MNKSPHFLDNEAKTRRKVEDRTYERTNKISSKLRGDNDLQGHTTTKEKKPARPQSKYDFPN